MFIYLTLFKCFILSWNSSNLSKNQAKTPPKKQPLMLVLFVKWEGGFVSSSWCFSFDKVSFGCFGVVTVKTSRAKALTIHLHRTISRLFCSHLLYITDRHKSFGLLALLWTWVTTKDIQKVKKKSVGSNGNHILGLKEISYQLSEW